MSGRRRSSMLVRLVAAASLALMVAGCSPAATATAIPQASVTGSPSIATSLVATPLVTTPPATATSRPSIFGRPLITSIFTADPAAHVFDNKLYVYVSHDLDHNNASTQNGDQYDMEDYHVLSFADMDSLPADLGQILNVKDVPWASKQMWAPDAAFKNGTYYLYFPAKDKDGIFRIGVATSGSPAGPFVAQKDPIAGSFSIDPAVFVDDDGQAYMYFGGLWGGQLEKWQSGTYDPNGVEPGSGQNALGPRIAKLSADMSSFDGPVKGLAIVDEAGQPLSGDDHDRRYFEAPWVHKYKGTYYLSYSTGDTHNMAYATSDSALGPFVFRGYVLPPVAGWTTHGSIVEFQGAWYLFYADNSLSGVDYKRCAKVVRLTYNADGTIPTIHP